MKILLLTGTDKLSKKLISKIEEFNNLDIILINSFSFKRLIKLIFKGSLSILLILKMFFTELFRKSYNTKNYNTISTNKELLQIIDNLKPDLIILFRAGLIINKSVISRNIPLYNVHCGSIPEYGGLGAINKAINDKAFIQNATMHQVTTTIDEGTIITKKEFTLDKNISYSKNENIAYDKGIELIIEYISKLINLD